MKVKDFINKINEIGFNDETEIVFDMKNDDGDTYKDFYCQSIYSLLGYDALSIEIDKDYK